MNGGTLTEVVATGLEAPSGIALKGGRLYVTDSASSTFFVFEKSGALVRKLATDLPAGSLAGLTFGPEGKIYFVDRKGSRILRIDPK